MHDNNKQKAFELVAPKSPEQIRQEASASAMPQARRAASQHRIAATAKWLFAQITDDSFMFDFGGDGYGTVFTTVKALAKRYHHDRDSITKWLEILVKRGLVWCEHEWPYVVVHVAAVVPNPAHKANRNSRVRARASAAQGRAGSTRTPLFVPKPAESASKTDVSRTRVTTEPARDADRTRTRSGFYPHSMRVEPARKWGRNPHTVPIEPAHHAGGFHIASGKDPHHGRAVSPVEGLSGQAGAEETGGGEVSEVKGGSKENLIKRSTKVNALKAAERGPRKASRENLFLEDVKICMETFKKGHGREEMSGSGAWWRLAYRAQADLAQRVLAELRVMIREGQVKTRPGAVAVDLWKRWGGPAVGGGQ